RGILNPSLVRSPARGRPPHPPHPPSPREDSMSNQTRRDFLADVGKGMFLSALGAGLAADLGLGAAWAADDPGSLTFGDLEPLVSFMHETPPGKMLPAVVEKVRAG